MAFTTGVVTRHPYPSPTPPSPATSSSDDRLYADGLGHRVAHLRWTSWGLCVFVCVSLLIIFVGSGDVYSFFRTFPSERAPKFL